MREGGGCWQIIFSHFLHILLPIAERAVISPEEMSLCKRRQLTTSLPDPKRFEPSDLIHAHLFENSYLQTRLGYWLHYEKWAAAAPTRDTLCIVHGYGESCARYDNLARAFAARGFTVYGLDLLGHGASEGKERFVLGDLASVVDGITRLITMATKPTPGAVAGKNFILAHSLGALFAVATVLKEPALKIDGLLLSAPILGVEEGRACAFRSQLVRVLLGRWWWPFPSLFPVFGDRDIIPVSEFCRSQSVAEQASRDPLMSDYASSMPAATLSVMFEAIAYVATQRHRLELPVHIQYGTQDRVVSLDAIHAFYASIPSCEKVMKARDGWFHDIFFECEADCEVRRDARGVTTNIAVADALDWATMLARRRS